jgi:hypothetical protein
MFAMIYPYDAVKYGFKAAYGFAAEKSQLLGAGPNKPPIIEPKADPG